MDPTLSRPLLSRLHKDLAELLDYPYPGVAVFTDDADIRKFCLVLTPSIGPWKDLSLHFDVMLPFDWPASPPKIKSSVVGIGHPNLFGDYICCDLLKGPNELQDGYTGGYSPALTLRGLFLQFLTFFSTTKIEQDYGTLIHIGDYMLSNYVPEDQLGASFFPCSRCSYVGRHFCSSEHTYISEQDSLEISYDTAPAPEETIATYQVQSGLTTHSCKRLPNGARLHKFTRVNPRWSSTLSRITGWKCRHCPYGSADLPVYREEQEQEVISKEDATPAYMVPPSTCLLEMLDDDILLELSDYLLSEKVVDLAAAYPRFRSLIVSRRMLLRRELKCFFLRTSIHESTIGIGIALDVKSRTLSSDFDWLSKEAFDRFGVGLSIEKREFEHFLPLAFSQEHFKRAQKDIWRHLQTIDQAVRDAERVIVQLTGRETNRRITAPRQPHQAVEVVYKMMNNIVVSLMKSCDHVLNSGTPNDQHRRKATLLHASEKAVVSYCNLFHLLLCLSRGTPEILQDATYRLRRFIQHPDQRSKQFVPDLGELIILLTLVASRPSIDGAPPVTWQTMNGPFLNEAVTRNVRWILQDLPDLEVMEAGTSQYRLQKTFVKSLTSLRLIMFQVTFLDVFVKTYAANIARLDENYGFPPQDIPERMVREVKDIYQVDSWPAFFRRVQYAKGLAFGAEKMSELLRAAIRKSGDLRYHIPKAPRDLHLLSRDREFLERKWIKARS